MSDSYIQLPPDGAGKKVRTVQKTISAQTVQSQFHVRDSRRAVAGSFSVVTPEITTTATANYRIASIFNTDATKKIVIKRVIVSNRCNAASLANMIQLQFLSADVTGTDISANIAKKDSADPASIATVKHTAGVTGTLAGVIVAYAKITVSSGTSELVCDYNMANQSVEEDEIMLNQNQGLVVTKLLAGDVDDRFTVVFEWEEY